MEENNNRLIKVLSISWIALSIIAVWAAYGLIINYAPEEYHFFGSTFEPLNTLFSGLAMAVLIVSIYFQSKQMAIQNDDLKLQKKELQNTRQVFEIQNFERTFFNLMENRNKLIDQLEHSSIAGNFGRTTRGDDATIEIIHDIQFYLGQLFVASSQKKITIPTFYLSNPATLKKALKSYHYNYEQFLFIAHFIKQKEEIDFFSENLINTYYDILINSLPLKEKKIISFFVYSEFEKNSNLFKRLKPTEQFPLLEKIHDLNLPPLISFTSIEGNLTDMGSASAIDHYFGNKKFIIRNEDERQLIVGIITLTIDDSMGGIEKVNLNDSETILEVGQSVTTDFKIFKEGWTNTIVKCFDASRRVNLIISAPIKSQSDDVYQMETRITLNQ